MAKYAVTYIETYSKTYVVETENYEEAEEKVVSVAENTPLICLETDFDHWDVLPSDTFGKREISEDVLDYYGMLPEE